MRVLGEKIHISVGTAIPFETILEDKNLLRSVSVIVNIRTLFRNFYQAYGDQLPEYKTLAKEFASELIYIHTLIKDNFPQSVINPVYLPSYASMKTYVHGASIKKTKTVIQNNYETMEALVIHYVIDVLKFNMFTKVDCILPGSTTRTLIITHIPLDLLSFNKYIKLSLLESHTGVIKERKEWIKKLTANLNYHILPFNKFTYQLLGDKSKLHESGGRVLINNVISVAISGKWSQLTTMDKILYDLKKYIKDKDLLDKLIKLTH